MNKRRVFFLALILILGSLLLIEPACGTNNEKTSSISPFQVHTVIVKDSSQQTTLRLGDDASIFIPPGSAVVGTTVTIQRLNQTDFPELPDWAKNVDSLYDFHLDTPLQGLVTIKILIPDTELSLLVHYSQNNWEVLPFIEENGMAVFNVKDLSIFGWLNIQIDRWADKIREFLTLRWLDEKPVCQGPNEETIHIDESQTLGFVLGCARSIGENKIQLTIYNLAPLHLDIFPIEGEVQLNRTGIFVSAEHEEGTIIGPRAKGKWRAEFPPGKTVIFEAYFSDAAVAAFVADILPMGRLARALIESGLFVWNGRMATWGDIKGFLIIPIFAELSQTMEEMQEMPILERGRISFTRKEETSSQPIPPEPVITCPPEGEPKFTQGDEVITTDGLKVRTNPGLAEQEIKIQPKWTSGTILNGPACQDNYVWRRVEYQDGVIGWSAEDWLEVRESQCNFSKPIPLRETAKYGIFGNDVFDTVVCGYLITREEKIWEEWQTNAYLVIVDFLHEGFIRSIEEGIQIGNGVNSKSNGYYEFNLGCFEDGQITGERIDAKAKERILGSSPENLVSLILSFEKQPGRGCVCCNLAEKVRLYE